MLRRRKSTVRGRIGDVAGSRLTTPVFAQSAARGGGVWAMEALHRIRVYRPEEVSRFFREIQGGRHPINLDPAVQRIHAGYPWLPITLAMLFKPELQPYCQPIVRRRKWRHERHNLVVNAGLTHWIGVEIAATTQITQWYVALEDDTPTNAAGDTYASHAGWTEHTDYDEATRPTYDEASGGTGALTNAASPATFTISASITAGGAALVGGGTAADTPGDTAGGGTLLCGVAFTGGDRALVDNDVLEVTYAISIADDGA